MPRRRRPTATSSFGAGRRESHDASAFYARFEAPRLSDDETINALPDDVPACLHGDARHMAELPDACVALVVTSPPYFAGKQYEEELGRDGVPGSYVEYIELLRDVFAECARVLEPGGRIAVNVANLGRRPFRNLAADVTAILQDDLRLLLRGEIVWRKGEGMSGSCAWGSFRRASSPTLRDTTERVVVAAKGRFDRARSVADRRAAGLPSESTLSADEFLAATLDVWELPPERATRVGHPAPFPVALPERLIGLFTFRGDVVLDPFMGSGSTLVAAARTGRRPVGYDTDPEYVRIARERLRTEGKPVARPEPARTVARHAEERLAAAGFSGIRRNVRIPAIGCTVPLVARDARGHDWCVEVVGSYALGADGLGRTDALWRTLGRAYQLARHGHAPVLVLTPHLPGGRSEADRALRAAGSDVVFDVCGLDDEAALVRVAAYAAGRREPLPGFWGG